MLGLEKEKKITQPPSAEKDETAASPDLHTKMALATTPSTQLLQKSQQYANQMVPIPEIRASQMALHPSYTYLPANAGALPTGQVSIILNNQIPQAIAPPPPPATPIVQPPPLVVRPTGYSSTNLLPRASYNSLNQVPNQLADRFPAPLPYSNRSAVPAGQPGLSYHQLPVRYLRHPSLHQMAAAQDFRRPMMPTSAGMPSRQQTWTNSLSTTLPAAGPTR
jgi:hypothetical protein